MKTRLGLLLASGIPLLAPQCPAASSPNVLFLFADDMRADAIGALGHPVVQTPHIDRLVKRGIVFNRAYMQGSMNVATCIPSRAMLLTGQSLFRVDESIKTETTWPQAFGQAGYDTFMSGKWHNSKPALLRSFHNIRGAFVGGMGHPMKAPLSDVVDGALTKPRMSGKHACEVFADETITFLRSPRDKPFFCYVPFDAPHDPHIIPDDFAIRYDPDKIPLPDNFLPEHPWDNGEMTVRDELLLPTPRTPGKIREMNAEYYRYITYLDSQIGRILDALESSPHSNNTIIVFSADSGVARGSHGLIGKQNLYEHSVRVPLILAGPGITAGVHSDALVYLHDLLPTLGRFSGVDPPPRSEGREFTAVLRDHTQPSRPQLFFAYKNVQRAVRDDRWKLIHYPQAGKTQLFDLQSDPQEIRNLADDPASTQQTRRLQELLEAEKATHGDRSAPDGKRSPTSPQTSTTPAES